MLHPNEMLDPNGRAYYDWESVDVRIDHDVPIPERITVQHVSGTRVNWGMLDVGDSVLLPLSGNGYYGLLRGLRNGFPARLFRADWVPGGLRVWRVK